jgi:hypothetical protein
VPLPEQPLVAQNIAQFAGNAGTAAVLNYSVPLPSHHTGRRAVLVEIGLKDAD